MKLYRDIKDKLKRHDDVAKLYINYKPMRDMTNEELLEVINENKRWHGGGLNNDYMTLKRKLSKRVKKGKGDSKPRREEVIKGIELLK